MHPVKKFLKPTEYTFCPHCKQRVSVIGLNQHQTTAVRCLKAQGLYQEKLVKQIVAPSTGIMRANIQPIQTGDKVPRCKHCQVKMPGAHPNKVYCSNRGAGNCKDAYHNQHTPRGIGIILQARREQREEVMEDEDFEYGHIFASGMDGHGQE